jgi:hypothetical protein
MYGLRPRPLPDRYTDRFGLSVILEATSYQDAIHSEWQIVMVEKIVALERTSKWDLILFLNIIIPSLVSRSIRLIKTRADGSLERGAWS